MKFPKPPKGTALLARREKRAARVSAEQREMRAVKRRDGGCRVPGCDWKARRLPLHTAHLRHRGMGGNPSGDRTTQDTMITLCVWHHWQMDQVCTLDIRPLTPQETDGPCEFLVRGESGDWRVVAVERTIGVSEMRGR